MKHLKVILAVLLALVCIVIVELAVARVFNPLLYYKLTDPVIDAVQSTVSKTVEAGTAVIKYTLESTRETFVSLGQSMSDFTSSILPEPKPEPLPTPDTQVFEDSILTPLLITNPIITHFGTQPDTGLEVLYGGSCNLFYYNQLDAQWGNYGTDSISGYGCGPTAMAMIVSSLTDQPLNPQEMSDWFVSQGYWAKSHGSYYTMANGTGAGFGLDVLSVPLSDLTPEVLVRHLMDGKLAVALMSSGHFTNGGHFIVLRGATLTGHILVADPASRERSISTWDAELIIAELSRRSDHAGAPLWFFS